MMTVVGKALCEYMVQYWWHRGLYSVGLEDSGSVPNREPLRRPGLSYSSLVRQAGHLVHSSPTEQGPSTLTHFQHSL